MLNSMNPSLWVQIVNNMRFDGLFIGNKIVHKPAMLKINIKNWSKVGFYKHCIQELLTKSYTSNIRNLYLLNNSFTHNPQYLLLRPLIKT